MAYGDDPYKNYGDLGYPPAPPNAPPPPPPTMPGGGYTFPKYGGGTLYGGDGGYAKFDGGGAGGPGAGGLDTKCDCSKTYPPGHACATFCGGGAGGAQQCPPMQGTPRKWDPSRNHCVFDCPPGTGYEPGGGGCKPCPPGTSQSEAGRCLPGLNGGGGGGAGGGGGMGGGGGAAPASPFGPGAQVTSFNDMLGKYITDLLGSPSRFTPEVMQSLYGNVAAQSSGAIQRNEDAVRAEAAGRGASRFGQTAAALRDVRNVAEGQRGAAMVGIQLQKINTDYQDKMGAIDRGQKYLDSLRDSEYRYTLLGEQRRQFDANLALAYANLAQNRSLLEMQLQSQWDMLKAQAGYNLLYNGA